MASRTIPCLALALLVPVAAAATEKLSKRETEALLGRTRTQLQLPERFGGSLRVTAKLHPLFDEGLPAGEYELTVAEGERLRREISLPGWSTVEVTAGDRSWVWQHDGSLPELAALANWAREAMEPRGLVPSKARRKALLVSEGREGLVEIEASPEVTLRVDAKSAQLRSWTNGHVAFRFEAWRSAGGRLWPGSVTISTNGRPVLRTELVSAAAGPRVASPEDFEPPAGAAERYREGAPGLELPVLEEAPTPSYPAAMRERGISGVVVLRAVIGVDGGVSAIEVLKSPHPDLTAAAIEAVRGRRYRPARRDGRPVELITTIRIAFQPR